MLNIISRYNLPQSMISACHKSLRCADVVGVVHDAANIYTKDQLHSDVINMLNSLDKIPSFLIINKVSVLCEKDNILAFKNLRPLMHATALLGHEYRMQSIILGLSKSTAMPVASLCDNRKSCTASCIHCSSCLLVQFVRRPSKQLPDPKLGRVCASFSHFLKNTGSDWHCLV